MPEVVAQLRLEFWGQYQSVCWVQPLNTKHTGRVLCYFAVKVQWRESKTKKVKLLLLYCFWTVVVCFLFAVFKSLSVRNKKWCTIFCQVYWESRDAKMSWDECGPADGAGGGMPPSPVVWSGSELVPFALLDVGKWHPARTSCCDCIGEVK